MTQSDYLIIGGGIAGCSIGYHLAKNHAVTLLEMEDHLGFHTTGRSAAFYAESYGGPTIQPLTSASKKFLKAPPKDFHNKPFLNHRGALHLVSSDMMTTAEYTIEKARKNNIPLVFLTPEEAHRKHSLLKDVDFKGAIFDPDCGDLDVAALHHAYIKGYKKKGGIIHLRSALINASYDGMFWTVETQSQRLQTKIIINAAGAWADHIADKCGITPLKLRPLRRTVITAPLLSEQLTQDMPLILKFDKSLYFKPESGQTLICPEDEHLSPPCDAQAELEDVALTIDRFEQYTGEKLARPTATWAGLRTFAADSQPVIGFDAHHPAFFWNVGQGGYGIQTCPSWSEIASYLAQKQPIPSHYQKFGCNSHDYTPSRFH